MMAKKAEEAKETKRQQKPNDIYDHAKKLKLAELLANPEDRRSKRDKFKEVGVSPPVAYEWMKEPAFREHLRELAFAFAKCAIGDVTAGLIRRASSGDTKAIELYLKWMREIDDITHVKVEGQLEQNVNIEAMNNLSDDELRRLADVHQSGTQDNKPTSKD